jgi:hypothetical protein
MVMAQGLGTCRHRNFDFSTAFLFLWAYLFLSRNNKYFRVCHRTASLSGVHLVNPFGSGSMVGRKEGEIPFYSSFDAELDFRLSHRISPVQACNIRVFPLAGCIGE